MSRFAFVDREEALYSVSLLCSLPKVSRSGYYAWRCRPRSARAVADEILTEQIRSFHGTSRRTYGAPRIHDDLAAAGVRVGRKRVARLMRAAGLQGVHRLSWRHTTRQDLWLRRRRTCWAGTLPHPPRIGPGRRRDLRADGVGLALPRDGAGRVLPPHHRLVAGQEPQTRRSATRWRLRWLTAGARSPA